MISRPEPKLGTRAEVLAVFGNIARNQGLDALRSYLRHCGITTEDIDRCGSTKAAILDHYRAGALSDAAHIYDIALVAYDLSRWPPVVERLRELAALANSTTPTIH